jgi:uncharacterized lipoprotein YmbA
MSACHARAVVGASLLTLFAGCAATKPPAIYILGDTGAPRPGVSSRTGLPVLEVMTVTVPDYLDTTDIMRRTGPNQVKASGTGQWGERLSVGVTDALAARLALLLPGDMIVKTEPAKPAPRLQVQIEQFDIAPDGSCTITASWQVLSSNHANVLVTERGTFPATATTRDDAAVAAALSQAVTHLANQIASTLKKVPTQPAKRTL